MSSTFPVFLSGRDASYSTPMIIQGPSGPKGDTGAQGVKGDTGAAGAQDVNDLTDFDTFDFTTKNIPIKNRFIAVDSAIAGKQTQLFAGTNITIDPTTHIISSSNGLIAGSNITISNNVISSTASGGGGGGGGATSYTGLSDYASANLPLLNTPLTNALATKVPTTSLGYVNVKDFAVGTPSNWAVPINAAITAALASSCRVFIPAGTYNISTTISVPNVIEIFGAGMDLTQLIPATANMVLFDFNLGNNNRLAPFHFHDFSIFVTTVTGVTGIRITGSVSNTLPAFMYNLSRIMFRTYLSGGIKTGIDMISCGGARINSCHFIMGFSEANPSVDSTVANPKIAIGISVADSINKDAGDNYITDCSWQNTGICIYQKNAGGLYAADSKFQASRYAYYLESEQRDDTPNGSEYTTFNSCNFDGSSVFLTSTSTGPAAGWASFILNNSICLPHIWTTKFIEVNPGTYSQNDFLTLFTCSNNQFYSTGTNNQIMVSLRATQGLSCTGNVFWSHGAGTCQPYNIASSCGQGLIDEPIKVAGGGTLVDSVILGTNVILRPSAGGGGGGGGGVTTYAALSDSASVNLPTLNSPLSTALAGKQNTLTAGSNITISGNTISAAGGGSATTPAGVNSSIQYNNNGAFGAAANLSTDAAGHFVATSLTLASPNTGINFGSNTAIIEDVGGSGVFYIRANNALSFQSVNSDIYFISSTALYRFFDVGASKNLALSMPSLFTTGCVIKLPESTANINVQNLLADVGNQGLALQNPANPASGLTTTYARTPITANAPRYLVMDSFGTISCSPTPL